ncbi:hypothetical protein Tco_1475750 [Tanacetum coccineum]
MQASVGSSAGLESAFEGAAAMDRPWIIFDTGAAAGGYVSAMAPWSMYFPGGGASVLDSFGLDCSLLTQGDLSLQCGQRLGGLLPSWQDADEVLRLGFALLMMGGGSVMRRRVRVAETAGQGRHGVGRVSLGGCRQLRSFSLLSS